MAPPVLVSVVVPVRDHGDGVRRVIERLRAQTLPRHRFEVLIGDDGSRPGSLDGVATEDGWVRVVTGPPQTSYAARNRAARAASAPVLAFCDSDCLPEPAWLEQGLAALERADVVAGEVTFSSSGRPTVWSLLTVDMFLDQERNVRTGRAVTANLFVRRALFERLGGFDVSLPSGGDYDFSVRAAALGATVEYAPHAVVRHPTMGDARSFLGKVWRTNRWASVRRARAGEPLDWNVVLMAIPVVGVARARRHAFRPAARLCRERLQASGIHAGLKEDLRSLPLLYFVVAYVAGAGRARGWLEGRRLAREGRGPVFASVSSPADPA
jgi:GT2 family glycosyltransferase